MGVDRGDGDDLAERPPARPGDALAEGAVVLPRAGHDADLRQRQLAEHDRYRRVVAGDWETGDWETGGRETGGRDAGGRGTDCWEADGAESGDAGVSPEAWGRAAPGLRAAWEEHRQRYPGRERVASQTQSDGSWTGDGNRRLTPEQNAEVTREYDRLCEIGRLHIVPALQAVEAEDPCRRLAAFEHRFKGEDRLREKIADQVRSTPGMTLTQAMALIPDAIRFTFEYSETTYTAGVLKDTERLQDRGFTLIESRNTWSGDQYKGINSRWRVSGSSAVFEVQFHTQASLEAKELTHKAYERIRSTAEDPELGELKAFQSRVNSLIPIPSDVVQIDDYPPEKRHG